jgi:hypothetical protein
MLSGIYAECHLCLVSIMLSFANKPIMLSVDMPNIVMLSVVMLTVVMLNVVMLSVVMPNVVILSVVTLNVVAPLESLGLRG